VLPAEDSGSVGKNFELNFELFLVFTPEDQFGSDPPFRENDGDQNYAKCYKTESENKMPRHYAGRT
jgi:hypothetical protein